MTIELTRDDFAHMTRRRQLQDGRWQTVCACGWLSRPEAHPDLLGWNCPQKPASASQGHERRHVGPATPESIAAAKADRDRQWRELEAANPGLRVLEDGTIIHPPPVHPRVQ